MNSPKDQPALPPIKFQAGGPTEEVREANLEAVLPSPGYPDAAILIADALSKHADTVLLDYTRDAVTTRYRVDGIWHPMPPRDRASGDYMLASIKKLAGLNFQERRARQEGEFRAEFRNVNARCKVISQGVRTGERVAIKLHGRQPKLEAFEDLGMRPKMQEILVPLLRSNQGMALISSLPGDGLSTTWDVALNTCDRLMRDFFVIEATGAQEKEVINVESVTYDPAKGETPTTPMPQLLLRQPDVIAVPDLVDAATVEQLSDLANEQNKMIIARIHAKHCVEALLRVLALRPPVEKFAKAISVVLNHRLVRRLCETCKQPYQPPPQLLQRLGIPQGRVEAFYRDWQPPPPEQMVDEKGNPIDVPICQTCQGIGFRGRIAVFELLVINDSIRQTLIHQPSQENLLAAARQAGHVTLKEEGIVLVARGVTSLNELQRVLKK